MDFMVRAGSKAPGMLVQEMGSVVQGILVQGMVLLSLGTDTARAERVGTDVEDTVRAEKAGTDVEDTEDMVRAERADTTDPNATQTEGWLTIC